MKKAIIFSLFLFLTLSFLILPPVLAAKCLDEKPSHAPDLFQIDVTRTTAKLYFTPVNNAVTNYTIVYGYEKGEQRFGISFPFGKYDGVINYTINELSPDMEYFFRVRADNGCRNGPLSDTMSVRTNWESKIYTRFKEVSVGDSNPAFDENVLKKIASLSKLTPQPSSEPSPTTAVVNASQVKGVSTKNFSKNIPPIILLIPLILLILYFLKKRNS